WRVRMVWLVVAGPAVVVLASVATLVVALRGADVPLREAPAKASAESMTPAAQARNHAAAPRRRAAPRAARAADPVAGIPDSRCARDDGVRRRRPDVDGVVRRRAARLVAQRGLFGDVPHLLGSDRDVGSDHGAVGGAGARVSSAEGSVLSVT